MKIKKCIKAFFLIVGGVVTGAAGMNIFMKKKIDFKNNQDDKYWALFVMMNQWVRIKQKGKNLSEYFEKNEYKKIAIYGMGIVGETLLSELKNSKIEVVYGIDRNAENIVINNILTLDDALPEVDAVVVTAVTSFVEIERTLSQKINSRILSLNDILYEL